MPNVCADMLYGQCVYGSAYKTSHSAKLVLAITVTSKRGMQGQIDQNTSTKMRPRKSAWSTYHPLVCLCWRSHHIFVYTYTHVCSHRQYIIIYGPFDIMCNVMCSYMTRHGPYVVVCRPLIYTFFVIYIYTNSDCFY